MSVQETVNHQWKVGDDVISTYYGLGKVFAILDCDEPNIRVKFRNGIIEDFYQNGNTIPLIFSMRKEGVNWFNESRGIQHCLIDDGIILTVDLEESDFFVDAYEHNLVFGINHELTELHGK